MNKKPILLALLLALAIVVAYAGFIASMPAVNVPAGPGNVQVSGPTAPPSTTQGTVTLYVTKP